MALIDELADALERADAERQPIPPLTDANPDLGVARAYAVQGVLRARKEARGERVVGHKVGLTSAAMQEMLGVDQPDFGHLTDAMVLPDGARVGAGALIAPRVEAEIAFRLGAPLRGPGVDRAAVLAAAEAVAPALEVIDSRIADWRITIADTVADNASSARVVLGAFRGLDALGADLAAVEATLRVEAGDGAAEEVTGAGAAVLGHPAEAVAWLANALGELGEGLEAGEVVLPGAMARALPVAAGSRARAAFGALGDVGATFTGATVDERSAR